MNSMRRRPMLCRVSTYSFPGFPSPTISFIRTLKTLAGAVSY